VFYHLKWILRIPCSYIMTINLTTLMKSSLIPKHNFIQLSSSFSILSKYYHKIQAVFRHHRSTLVPIVSCLGSNAVVFHDLPHCSFGNVLLQAGARSWFSWTANDEGLPHIFIISSATQGVRHTFSTNRLYHAKIVVFGVNFFFGDTWSCDCDLWNHKQHGAFLTGIRLHHDWQDF